MSNTKFDAMGKVELRVACKEAGVKNYGKMNNEGMREALRAATVPTPRAKPKTPAKAPAKVKDTPVVRAGLWDVVTPTKQAKQAAQAGKATPKGVTVRDGQARAQKPVAVDREWVSVEESGCPECGKIHEQNPISSVTNQCGHCNHTYSIAYGFTVHIGSTRPNAPKGYTIEKIRETQNGVTRKSKGTRCGDMWDYLDANPQTKAADLKGVAEKNGWNLTNLTCQLYYWRKFHGIKARQS